MKKNFKIYGMVLLCLISLSIGCSKDSYNIQETQKDKSTVVSQRTITGAEALAIGQKLATSLSSITGKTTTNYGTIDYSEIKNVINNNGKENYTFRIKNHPESSETVFFNLVMTQREGYTTVMLMKYEMDADFAKAYYTESKSFSKFGGRVTTSLISSNDPCPPVVVPPIVIPYGGYPPDTTPDQGSDDNGLPSIPLFTILDANDNNDGNTGTSTGTPNTGTAPAAENNNCCPWAQRGSNFRIAVNNGDDAEDPCPKDNTAGILSPEALESFNDFTASLYNNQFDWLNAYENHVTRITLFHYLYDNNFDDESIAFAKEIIVRMVQDPTIFKSITPFLIEKKIDDASLPPCAKNIVSAIKGLSQNDFAKIIARLGGAHSVYKVTITPVDNLTTSSGDGTLAETKILDVDNNLYNYGIAIDSQYLSQGTKLSIASTILHELIHAYFLSLVADQYTTGNSALDTFPELWDYYVTHSDLMTSGGSPQHSVMAQNYIDVLGSAIQEYATGSPVSAANPLQQIYKDIAWGGLSDTTPYNSLPQIEKDRIAAVNKAEDTNSPQTENGTTHSPTSTPCN